MKKKLLGALIAAALTLPLATHARDFTINPGSLGGGEPAPFQADLLTGNGSSFGVGTANGALIVGSAWVNLTSASLNGTALNATGLIDKYQLWVEASYTLALDSGSGGQPGSTYHFQSLHTDLWVDPTIATPTTFIQSTSSGNPAVVLHGAGAEKLGSFDLTDGQSGITARSGLAAVSDSSITLNAHGTAFFNNTFDGQVSLAFINPGSTAFSGTNFISGTNGGGVLNLASPVPEPSEWAMMLAGVLMVGAIATRRRNQL